MKQCVVMKKNMKRCSRLAVINNTYCTQHFKCIYNKKTPQEKEWDRIWRGITHRGLKYKTKNNIKLK